jgi:hypothetical protein
MRKIVLLALAAVAVVAFIALSSNTDSQILKKIRINHDMWGPACRKVFQLCQTLDMCCPKWRYLWIRKPRMLPTWMVRNSLERITMPPRQVTISYHPLE